MTTLADLADTADQVEQFRDNFKNPPEVPTGTEVPGTDVPLAMPDLTTSMPEHLLNLGIWIGIGIVVVFALAGLLRARWAREWFSTCYRLCRMPMDLMSHYAELWDAGQFKLNQDRAIFLGLATIGFMIFASAVLVSILGVFTAIINVVPLGPF